MVDKDQHDLDTKLPEITQKPSKNGIFEPYEGSFVLLVLSHQLSKTAHLYRQNSSYSMCDCTKKNNHHKKVIKVEKK